MELTQLKYFMAAVNCGQIVQAAEVLHVSLSTVRTHSQSVYRKLGVHSKQELILLCESAWD